LSNFSRYGEHTVQIIRGKFYYSVSKLVCVGFRILKVKQQQKNIQKKNEKSMK
jgi:hypothetical protein